MKKAEFTHELESRLNGMKQDEIESSVKSCTQTIDMMMFTGMNEDEAVAVLGDINILASKIRTDKGYTDTQHYQMENGSSADANNNYINYLHEDKYTVITTTIMKVIVRNPILNSSSTTKNKLTISSRQ